MKLKTVISSLLAVFAYICLSACEHEIKGPEDDDPATLGNIQSTIFAPRCATTGCHVSGGSAPMRMDTKSQSFNNLVGVTSSQKSSLQRVASGQPDNSYLIHKIDGQPNISNRRMPPGGPFLSSEETALIRQWIQNGAENN